MQIEEFKWEPELKKQNHNLYEEEKKKKGLNVWSSIFWSWNKIKLKCEVKWKLLSRVRTQVSHIAVVFFTSWATREALRCDVDHKC